MFETILRSKLETELATELDEFDIVVSNDTNYDPFNQEKPVGVIIRTSIGNKSGLASFTASTMVVFVEVLCLANDTQEVLAALNKITDKLNGVVATDTGYSYQLKLNTPSVIGSPFGVRKKFEAVKGQLITWTGEALYSGNNVFNTAKYYISLNAGTTFTEIKYMTGFNGNMEIIAEPTPLEGENFAKQSAINLGVTYSITAVRVYGDTLQDALVTIRDGTGAINQDDLKFKKDTTEISIQKIEVIENWAIGTIPTITITLTR